VKGPAVDAPPDPGEPRAADFEPLALRRVFGAFPTGVTALAALLDGAPVGMAASTFVPVSLDPPLVSVCAALTSTTWPRLRTADRLGISVLSAGQEGASRRLSSAGADRFAGLGWRSTPSGAVLLDGAAAWFECSPVRELPAGDHVIALLRLHALSAAPDPRPLVFHAGGYRALAP
jgi:flavin reductase (DIM6/NTAB) family NADH-FMN oxidoreductase RutF